VINTVESRSYGYLDWKVGERGTPNKGETRGWERLSHSHQIELVDHQSLIEVEKEMKNYQTSPLQ
jgi:hypothetical protein